MTTSGTATWNLDILDIIEDAYERAGIEIRAGYDLRTARRSLNLLAAEWANRGLNLWTIDSGTIPLVAGTATYSLPLDTIDIIEHVLRSSSSGTNFDYTITRIGVGDYAKMTTKDTQGRPTQVYVSRTTAPSVTLWPVPDQAYTLVYWRLRRIEDSITGTDNVDIPVRFLPAITAGLAFYLGQKRTESAALLPELQKEYERQFALAADEDRGRESFMLVPWVR